MSSISSLSCDKPPIIYLVRVIFFRDVTDASIAALNPAFIAPQKRIGLTLISGGGIVSYPAITMQKLGYWTIACKHERMGK